MQVKLVDLEPRWMIGASRKPIQSAPDGWVGPGPSDGWHERFDSTGRVGMGMSFTCPSCRNHRLFVMFANPIDGGAPYCGDPKYDPVTWQRTDQPPNLWTRTGDTFETLTLFPSVQPQCCHGAVQNGAWVSA